MMLKPIRFFVVTLLLAGLTACGTDKPEPSSSPSPTEDASTASSERLDKTASPTARQLHKQLKAKNPDYDGNGKFEMRDGQVVAAVLRETGVSDLTPLEGLPLRGVDLYGNPVSDLSVLKDMPLKILYLEETDVKSLDALKEMELQVLYISRTAVDNLAPLKGMPLKELNIVETPVQDLSPLKEVPLQMLWLNNTPVQDLAPLKNAPLVSLTLKGTQVNSLQAVQEMPNLQRLHIAETPVSDLRPLNGMQLERLVFTPGNISQGISQVRQMESIKEIGTVFNSQTNKLMKPAQFWKKYDQGAFK